MENLQETLKKTVAKRVVKQRTTMNYSQGEVLGELEKRGIARTQGSLSQIERGKRLPSVETLYVLAQYLETSTDYLLGLTENELSATDAEEERNTFKGDSQIDKIMAQLSQDDREVVLGFAAYLMARRDAKAAAPTDAADILRAEIKSTLDLVERQYGYDARAYLEGMGRDNTGPLSASS